MTAQRLDRSTWPARTRPLRAVHIGVGNFSRAHQAWYTQHADESGQWGVVAFTGRSSRIADQLGPQDGLYTLIERGEVSDRLEVIDVINAVRPASDLAALATVMAEPQTAVVTLTVTEAGYTDATELDGLPSVPARIVSGLAARRQRRAGPLAIVSCDNVNGGGAVLRELTLAAAERSEGDQLREWIGTEVAFVETSVDRITPHTTDADRELVRRELGRVDSAPVVCEVFSDWVLSGEFPAGRPAWEHAGARFVSDIEPWERRKLWLLNGGHSLLAYVGLLRGRETVAEAVALREVADALERFWDLAQRHLPVWGLALPDYRRELTRRFANPRIAYPLGQIAADGLGKLRNRVVPVIEAASAAGESAEPALLVLAAWIQWLDGVDDLSAVDASAAELAPILARGGGEERTRALIELLMPGWGARSELTAEIERLRLALAGAA